MGKISASTTLLLILLSVSSTVARTPAFIRSSLSTTLVDTFHVSDDELASISICSESIPLCLLELRGGERYDDEYDDEEGYDEMEDEAEQEFDPYAKRRRSPPPRVSNRRQPPGRRPSASNMARRRGPPRKKSKPWAQRIATQSLQMTGQLAWTAVKTPGKMAYHVMRPKYVELKETGGLWRMDQQVTSRGKEMASVATVELDSKRKLVIVRHRPIENENDQEKGDEEEEGEEEEPKEVVIRQSYTFTKSRLGSYKTSFVAPAFLVGDKPRMYGYKGTWQRKMADKKVIKLVGKIYEVRRQRFGKDRGSYQFAGKPVGTFVARRRVQLEEEEEEDDDDDDYFVDSDDEAEQDYGEDDYDEEMYD